MGDAKRIEVKPIKPAAARSFIERWHYSGKAYCKSRLHFGAFLDGLLIGVQSYGDPLDRRKVLPLVRDTKWNDMLELNRMAMRDDTPQNSESRFISVCARLIRKNYPNIEWLLSFSDGTRCGDGTIYRASGFLLTGIKKNNGILDYNGFIFTVPGINTSSGMRKKLSAMVGEPVKSATDMKRHGAKALSGYQLRYILPLRPGVRERLTVPVLPYSEIQKRGAGMYLGQPKSYAPEALQDALTVPGQRRQPKADPGAPLSAGDV